MEVTSLEELREIARGEVIPLPGFTANKPFAVRVKRVSLLGLVQKGTIPNTLLGAANELFYGKSSTNNNKSVDMKELTKVMTIMAESALLEPTAAQMKELELELTDTQIVALFNYTQEGFKGIEKFHKESTNNVSSDDGEKLQNKAKSDN